MSTAPVVTEAAMNALFEQVLSLLAKKLAPAKLKLDGSEGSKNAHVMNSWAIRQGIHRKFASMTPQAIANEFYLGVVADVQSEYPQLIWVTPPKALVRRLEKVKDPNARQDFRAIEDLSKRMQESHKADERIKEQEAAEKRVLGLIAAFCPTKRGVLKYALRDEMQAKWQKQLAGTKDSFTRLEEAIRDEQEDIYAELEAPQRV